MQQEEINALLVEKARAGKQVVRLKGGDPFLFGRGGEEAQALAAAGISFEIVPGVTSAIAAPAYAGIPVTHRGLTSHVTFFTGHEDPEKTESAINFEALAQVRRDPGHADGSGANRSDRAANDGHGVSPGFAGGVGPLGNDWPAGDRCAELCANIAQKVAEKNFAPPAVAIFGEVVSLGEELGWQQRAPLCGKRIVVTRTRKQAGALSEQLRGSGPK